MNKSVQPGMSETEDSDSGLTPFVSHGLKLEKLEEDCSVGKEGGEERCGS